MSHKLSQLEDLKQLQSVRLAKNVRTRMEAELTAYTELHQVPPTTVHAGEQSTHTFAWSQLYPAFLAAPVIALLVFIVVSSTPTTPVLGPEVAVPQPPVPTRASKQLPGSEQMDADVSNMMMLEPLSVETQIEHATARIDGLRAVVTTHKTELGAESYTSFTSTLTEAARLTAIAHTQNEVDALATISAASELAGEVESALSLLGTVTIDPNTGAIVDIDFSTPPPRELHMQY